MSTQFKFLMGAGAFSIVVAIVYWYLGYESAGFVEVPGGQAPRQGQQRLLYELRLG